MRGVGRKTGAEGAPPPQRSPTVPEDETQTPTPLPKLLDTDGFARQLGVSTQVVNRLQREGELVPLGRLYNRLVYHERDVGRLLAERVAAELPPPPERLPRLPGAGWRQRACNQCGAIYQPRGANDPRCSDECRKAHRVELEMAR